jgi:hypothetical protein
MGRGVTRLRRRAHVILWTASDARATPVRPCLWPDRPAAKLGPVDASTTPTYASLSLGEKSCEAGPVQSSAP